MMEKSIDNIFQKKQLLLNCLNKYAAIVDVTVFENFKNLR
jgi:uncharacterized protein YkvS